MILLARWSRRLKRRSDVVDRFHKFYYDADLQRETYYRGRQIIKCPLDLWQYHEILYETRPDFILETGALHGASALWFADQLDLLGVATGRVCSVDITRHQDIDYPSHPRIEFLLGKSSVDPEVVEVVTTRAKGRRTMVVLDSNHSYDHVLREIEAYAPLVTPGCYLVVEDTNVNGQPVLRRHGPGPTEALKAWRPHAHGFEADRRRERFLLTFLPGGFLRRVR